MIHLAIHSFQAVLDLLEHFRSQLSRSLSSSDSNGPLRGAAGVGSGRRPSSSPASRIASSNPIRKADGSLLLTGCPLPEGPSSTRITAEATGSSPPLDTVSEVTATVNSAGTVGKDVACTGSSSATDSTATGGRMADWPPITANLKSAAGTPGASWGPLAGEPPPGEPPGAGGTGTAMLKASAKAASWPSSLT